MVDPLAIPPVIQVVPYDPRWAKAFEEEAKKLEHILGKNCLGVHHIGSTSVPGLHAKPVIDIMIVVKNILDVDKAVEHFEKLGYSAKGEFGIPFRRHFQKGDFLRTHNIHIFEEGAAEIDNHIHFRDYLKTSPQASQEYAELKIELAKRHPHNIIAYCEGKEGFVHKILSLAQHKSLRLVVALSKSEFRAVDEFRQQKHLVKEGYTHILLFLGILPIGYAEIFHDRVTMCVIKDDYAEHLKKFNELLARWLEHQKLFKRTLT
ncbi:MAG: GrpB family protein [Verrucomicrobia bacterium]|nr:GrpB family protein [Verrucomicrobiota bacterium]MBS0636340.1 GrpB family protein [Verrucomicrobiota bacterium]